MLSVSLFCSSLGAPTRVRDIKPRMSVRSYALSDSLVRGIGPLRLKLDAVVGGQGCRRQAYCLYFYSFFLIGVFVLVNNLSQSAGS